MRRRRRRHLEEAEVGDLDVPGVALPADQHVGRGEVPVHQVPGGGGVRS